MTSSLLIWLTDMRRALLLLASLSFGSCSPVAPTGPAPDAEKQSSIQGPKVIGVLIYDGVLTSDVTAPLEVFGSAVRNQPELAGYKVVTIAPERRPVNTEEGVTLLPQYSVHSAPPLTALIVGSAYDMDGILENGAVGQFIRRAGNQARWLGSNCSGARLLGQAGLLAGREVTTYPGGELMLKLRHPRVHVKTGRRYTVDGNLVSSNGGLVSYEASFALLAQMTSKTVAQKVASQIYYDRLTGRRIG